jgi:stage III sporulation protein AE
MEIHMKKIIIILIMLIILPISALAYEAPQMDGEDTFNETVQQITDGSFKIDPINIINFIIDGLLKEIRESAADIIILLSVAAMSGIIGALTGAFGEKGGGEAAFFACFTLMSTAALRCFITALEYGTQVIDSMCVFINKLSPLLMIVLLSCGKITTANTFHPVLSAAVYIISIIIRSCLVPLVTFSAVLSVAGNINSKMQISNFTKVVRSVSKWLMAAIITIFTGISAVYGFSAPALDAVSAKAVKFAVGSMVPVVGNFLSDTLETVVSGTKLMKNAVGVSGIVIMCIMCAVPVIKIAIMQFMLKLTAAVAEPLTDSRISKMLWEMSEAVTTVFGIVVMVAVLFMVNISIIIAATNG